jgi:hypothetical protein
MRIKFFILPFIIFSAGCVQRRLGNSGKLAAVSTESELKGCTVQIPPSLQASFLKSQDPFFIKIIQESIPGGCINPFNSDNSATHVKAMAKMLVAKGCTAEGRALLSEDGNYKTNHSHRFIDVFQCGTGEEGRVWVTDTRQVMAMDPATGGFNFYTSTSSTHQLLFHGNSFQQALPTESQGFFNHPCTKCHNNGALVMKELRLPWVNWQTPIGIPATQVFSQLKDAQKLLNEANEEVGTNRLFIAENVEISSIFSQVIVNKTRIQKLLANEPIAVPADSAPQPPKLQDTLKPLFCDTEAVISTVEDPLPADGNTNGVIRLPLDLFINRVLIPERGPKINLKGVARGGDSRLDMTGFTDTEDERPRLTPSLAAASGQGGLWVVPDLPAATWVPLKQSKNLVVPGAASSSAPASIKTGRFPMVFPSRSFVDDDFITRAIRSGLFDEKMVADVLMVDFSNPAFSERRCQLLQKIPNVELGSLGSGTNLPAGIKKAVDDALESATEPGAVEYNKNKVASLDDHANRIMAFQAACTDKANTARIANDPENLYRLIRSRRTRWYPEAGSSNMRDPAFAVENFVRRLMVPDHDNLSQGKFQEDRLVGLDEKCRFRASL